LREIIESFNFKASLQNRYNISDDYCLTQLVSYMESNGAHYPLHIGDDEEMSTDNKIKLILYLVSLYLFI
jgi:hypothetical protein